MSQLTHINAAGEAHMVDVSAKAETVREARAEAFVTMLPETLAMIIDGSHHKGDLGPHPALPSADAQQSGGKFAGAAGA